MREIVIETLLVALLNLRYPGSDESLKPSCVHLEKYCTQCKARTEAGEMIVSTASGQ